MLSVEEEYILQKRIIAWGMSVRKKAKGGRDYNLDLCEANMLSIKIQTANSPYTNVETVTQVPNTRIFEGIFE